MSSFFSVSSRSLARISSLCLSTTSLSFFITCLSLSVIPGDRREETVSDGAHTQNTSRQSRSLVSGSCFTVCFYWRKKVVGQSCTEGTLICVQACVCACLAGVLVHWGWSVHSVSGWLWPLCETTSEPLMQRKLPLCVSVCVCVCVTLSITEREKGSVRHNKCLKVFYKTQKQTAGSK